MKKRLCKVLIGAFLLLGGVGVTVVAQTASQESDITGTIEVMSLATVTEDDTVAAAQQALGVTDAPTEVELEVENGFLVWAVELAGQEVMVDAGSGEVLLIKVADDDAGVDDAD